MSNRKLPSNSCTRQCLQSIIVRRGRSERAWLQPRGSTEEKRGATAAAACSTAEVVVCEHVLAVPRRIDPPVHRNPAHAGTRTHKRDTSATTPAYHGSSSGALSLCRVGDVAAHGEILSGRSVPERVPARQQAGMSERDDQRGQGHGANALTWQRVP